MRRLYWLAILVIIFAVAPAQAFDPRMVHQLLVSSRLSLNDFGLLISTDEKDVFEFNATRKFTPASVSKVITGAAALELLGPNYKFRTPLLYDGSIVDQTVRGSLYIRNGGDPSFHSGRLITLLAGLKKYKIKSIEGDLIIDDSRFKDVNNPQWLKNINAINPEMFPLFVRIDPASDDLKKEQKKIYRKVMDLEGRFVVYQNMIEPDIRTGQQFVQMMKKSGITLKGKVKRGEVSKSAQVLAEVVSPLTNVVRHMLKTSNNFYADLLVRDIAYAFGERPGTYATGIDFLTFYLDHVNVLRSSYVLNSGSGFSHKNAITPRAMVRLLKHMKSQKTISPYAASSFPVAGVSGTLIRRMATTSARGRVWAKTGYLRQVANKTSRFDGAVSLAGYAVPPKGDPFTFTFFYNGNAHPETVKSLFDKICAHMIGYIPGIPKQIVKTSTKKVKSVKGKKPVASKTKTVSSKKKAVSTKKKAATKKRTKKTSS